MITADTITDEQIRELRDGVDGPVALCNVALGGVQLHRVWARKRCAEILNARKAT